MPPCSPGATRPVAESADHLAPSRAASGRADQGGRGEQRAVRALVVGGGAVRGQHHRRAQLRAHRLGPVGRRLVVHRAGAQQAGGERGLPVQVAGRARGEPVGGVVAAADPQRRGRRGRGGSAPGRRRRRPPRGRSGGRPRRSGRTGTGPATGSSGCAGRRSGSAGSSVTSGPGPCRVVTHAQHPEPGHVAGPARLGEQAVGVGERGGAPRRVRVEAVPLVEQHPLRALEDARSRRAAPRRASSRRRSRPARRTR